LGAAEIFFKQKSYTQEELTFSCLKCRRTTGQQCDCIVPKYAIVDEMNPKYASKGNGKAYIKGGPRNFLVTDDLRVIHFSLTNTLQVMRAAKVPKEELVEKQLSLDKTQVDPYSC
jgi:hypothetical protein